MNKKTTQDFSEGIRITNASLILNISLVILKLFGGIFGHSYALIADALHSLSDLFSDFAVLVGLKIAGKPKDKDHQYGHGKFENYTAHLVGVLLVILGVFMGYEAAKKLYFHVDEQSPGYLAIFGAVISIISKEIIYQLTIKVGKKIKSNSLIANAWHHRSDAFSSVAALFGIVCAFFSPRLHVMDYYMALLIAFFVIRVGIKISWDALKTIVDTSPSEEICRQIKKMILTVDGVKSLHGFRARYYSSSIFVDIHITVDPNISVREGHAIADRVEKLLQQEFDDILDVTTHVDPHSGDRTKR